MAIIIGAVVLVLVIFALAAYRRRGGRDGDLPQNPTAQGPGVSGTSADPQGFMGFGA